jgi:hypothetical protein
LALRSDGIVGRLGGDELAILLKGCRLAPALDFAKDLQKRLSALKLAIPGGSVGATCSFGASEFRPGDTIDELLKRADIALYRAKREGRNRVIAAPGQDLPAKGSRAVRHLRLLPRPSPKVQERRHQSSPGDGLLARICAVIDLLVSAGLSDRDAAETMAQRLRSAGVTLPRSSPSANWADHILAWRATFRAGIVSDGAFEEYSKVMEAISSVPPEDRLECVLENDLWNRRRTTLRRETRAEPQLH